VLPRMVVLIGCIAFAAPGVLRADSDSADSELEIDVSPQYCHDPCLIRVQVHLDPHPDDRALVIEADNGEYFRSSLIQLSGERAPAVHSLTLKGLPAGRFVISAALSRSDGLEALAQDRIDVLGM
jgi:hypothetical protein